MIHNKNVIFTLLILFFSISCTKTNLVSHQNYLKNEIKSHPTRFTVNYQNSEKMGLFNSANKVILYDKNELLPFQDGYCLSVDNNIGTILDISVIDTNGKKLFSYKTDGIWDIHYNNGYFISKLEKTRLYNAVGIEVNEIYIDGFSIVPKNGLYAYKASNGNYLRSNDKKIILSSSCFPFCNGFAVIGDIKKNLYGLIDTEGNEILQQQYTYLYGPKYSSIIASNDKNANEAGDNPVFGILDFTNKWIVKPIYYDCFIIDSNYFAVRTKKLSAAKIDINNYCNTIYFSENIKVINSSDNSEMLITKPVLLQKNNRDYEWFNNGVAIFYDIQTNKYGLISYNNTIIQDAVFDVIKTNPDNGYWQVCKSGKWYLYKEGENLIDPLEYLDFSSISKKTE